MRETILICDCCKNRILHGEHWWKITFSNSHDNSLDTAIEVCEPCYTALKDMI